MPTDFKLIECWMLSSACKNTVALSSSLVKSSENDRRSGYKRIIIYIIINFILFLINQKHAFAMRLIQMIHFQTPNWSTTWMLVFHFIEFNYQFNNHLTLTLNYHFGKFSCYHQHHHLTLDKVDLLGCVLSTITVWLGKLTL